MEEWKDIPNYEGLYQVSNLGRVKSLNYLHTSKEQVLKTGKDRHGYLQVNLYKNGKMKTFKVHRLVAIAFVFNPLNKPYINHIDCDPKNNNADNLEWVTQKENIQYAAKLGRLKSAENSKKSIKKRSKSLIAINLITGEETYFDSQHEASRQLKLSVVCINHVLKGRHKKTGNYIFKYIDEKQEENTLF